MRKIVGLVCAAAVLASGSANAAGLLSYTGPSVKFKREGRNFRATLHPKEDLILLQPGMTEAFKGYNVDAWPADLWRATAEYIVLPVGCSVTKVEAKSVMGGTWEAGYSCPQGVDLRSIFKTQRKALESGEALRPA